MWVGMAIGPRPYEHPQRIPTMGRVKPPLWVWSWVWVITRKFGLVWALYYPAPQLAYMYLYNMINNLFIFGVQLIN